MGNDVLRQSPGPTVEKGPAEPFVMTDAQKLAVKKFLFSVKGAVMAMDVETLKDDQLVAVLNNFAQIMHIIYEESGSGD